MKYILIVEDERNMAELEKDYLQVNGFKIDIEETGRKALRKALKIEYNMVILDIMLPDIDGFEVCKKIREKKDIPILFVSAKTDDIDKIRGFGLGADDYITKPFSPSELVARVKAHLARYDRLVGKDNKENDILKVRELEIDRTARRAFVQGKEITLTSKEFNLLTFLAAHPNRVFSKEELFQKIWGMKSVGESATVTVHIKKIREKIEGDVGKQGYIETIWGIGYRFRL